MNNLAMAFVFTLVKKFVLTIQEQSFNIDNVIIQTATMNTISASTERILVKMSYEPSQSLIQKNKFQTERTTSNCLQTPPSLKTASPVAMKG